MTPRALFYVQHLLGVGHLKRAAILAEAIAAEGLAVTVAYGGRAFREVTFAGVDVASLPSAAIAGENFSTLLDQSGQPVDDLWRSRRRDTLLELCSDVDPDVVLIELFPFGRRQFAFELIPLLEKAHASRKHPLVACSVRDVLVASKRPGRDEEIIERLRRFFDVVFVHGDPALIPFGATFPAADRISDLIRYTGYVSAPAGNAKQTAGRDEVLVSAGGGAVGAQLLLSAAEARPQTSLANHVWRFLTGPNFPDADFQKLAAMANDRMFVERFRPDFPARLRNAALSISQAGYNTTMDILAAGVRAVVVPYESMGETEQRLRAEILAGKGVLALVPEAELSPARLAAAVAKAVETPLCATALDLSGAQTTARLVHELAMRRMP